MFIFNVKLFLYNNKFCYSIKNKIINIVVFLFFNAYYMCFNYRVWAEHINLVYRLTILMISSLIFFKLPSVCTTNKICFIMFSKCFLKCQILKSDLLIYTYNLTNKY